MHCSIITKNNTDKPQQASFAHHWGWPSDLSSCLPSSLCMFGLLISCLGCYMWCDFTWRPPLTSLICNCLPTHYLLTCAWCLASVMVGRMLPLLPGMATIQQLGVFMCSTCAIYVAAGELSVQSVAGVWWSSMSTEFWLSVSLYQYTGINAAGERERRSPATSRTKCLLSVPDDSSQW